MSLNVHPTNTSHAMKHTALVIGAGLWISASLLAADPSPSERHAEAAKLLDGLPSRSRLYRAEDAIHKQGYTDSERAAARKLFDVAKERIPKLRPLIVAGDNVF